jgi:hypothetical protein
MDGVGFEKANIIGTCPSVEQSMAETPYIHMCLNAIISSAADAGATGLFLAISKHL